jgi:hypothetical protein
MRETTPTRITSAEKRKYHFLLPTKSSIQPLP